VVGACKVGAIDVGTSVTGARDVGIAVVRISATGASVVDSIVGDGVHGGSLNHKFI
jgi:hypothetical protein